MNPSLIFQDDPDIQSISIRFFFYLFLIGFLRLANYIGQSYRVRVLNTGKRGILSGAIRPLTVYVKVNMKIWMVSAFINILCIKTRIFLIKTVNAFLFYHE